MTPYPQIPRRPELGRAARGVAATLIAALGLAGVIVALIGLTAAGDSSAATSPRCTPGARTLATPGDVIYPEVGNGGYRSLHTSTHTVYDAVTNRFLPGNQVALTDRATQCLSSLSLDFQPSAPGDPAGGPDLQVQSVSIDGTPATFAFAQPTYPGDPHGADDPDPRAHEASQNDPVGGPDHDPLPPACSPELPAPAVTTLKLGHDIPSAAEAENGTQCPADKLVITPATPIRDGATFTITVAYTGTPGVRHDADGAPAGWFRTPDGGWADSEPIGTEDWMPLNDVPSAKPTYDFSITTERGLTAIANGERTGITDNPPNAEFPHGSATTVWHAPMGIASYLALTVVGRYTSTVRTVDGVRYYAFISRALSAARRAQAARVVAQQPAMTRVEQQLGGRFPFASDGVVVGGPATRGACEETESMILLAPGCTTAPILAHENTHQWWGDDVSEATFAMAFFKEGMAQMGMTTYTADRAADRVGGATTSAGRAVIRHAFVSSFDSGYRSFGAGAWQIAPARRSAFTYIDFFSDYVRPLDALIALRQVLGVSAFDASLRGLRRRDAGATVAEPQVIAAFAAGLPERSAACHARLTTFFHQWFDTAYHGSQPQITGPGLDGHSFFGHGCRPSAGR